MNEHIREWAAEAQSKMAEIGRKSAELQRQAAAETKTHFDSSKNIGVKVNQHGRILKLKIKPEALDRYDLNEVADVIVRLSTEASVAMQSEIAEKYNELWGAEISPTDVAAGKATVSDLVSQIRNHKIDPMPRSDRSS